MEGGEDRPETDTGGHGQREIQENMKKLRKTGAQVASLLWLRSCQEVKGQRMRWRAG